ncbi:hypothetical protein [Metasolibacillus sp.]|nr:hypothetical protein [Metasolibacillus sp.]
MMNELKNYRKHDAKLSADELNRKFKTWYHKTFNRPQKSRHNRTK